MANNERIVLIVGNGPVGTAVASRLKVVGVPMDFVGRKGDKGYIKNRFEAWNTTTYMRIRSLADADVSSVCAVFFCLQAFDLEGGMERYLAYMPRGIPIIPVTTGRSEEIVARVAKRHPDFIWRIGLAQMEVAQASHAIYQLIENGAYSPKVIWGPYGSQNSHPTDVEARILGAENGTFFEWNEGSLARVRKQWIVNLVTDSLSAAGGLSRHGDLLNDMKTLKMTLEEAYRLGQDTWGSWRFSYDKILEELVSFISRTAAAENRVARDLRLGNRIESPFLSKVSDGHPSYPLLGQLSATITDKTRQNN